MLSVIIGALLFLVCALIGLSIKHIYRERYEIFCDLTEFCNFYELEIKSRKTTLPEIIDIFISSNKGELVCLLDKVKKNNFFINYSEKEVLSITKRHYCKDEDNMLIAEFFRGLGKNGIDIEMTNIIRFKGIFEEKTKKYKENLNKNGEMYYKLFVVLGVAIMILVV